MVEYVGYDVGRESWGSGVSLGVGCGDIENVAGES